MILFRSKGAIPRSPDICPAEIDVPYLSRNVMIEKRTSGPQSRQRQMGRLAMGCPDPPEPFLLRYSQRMRSIITANTSRWRAKGVGVSLAAGGSGNCHGHDLHVRAEGPDKGDPLAAAHARRPRRRARVPPRGASPPLIFYSSECPISNAYSPTLNRLVEIPGPVAQAVGVCVDPDLSAAEVAAHAKDFGLKFPVVHDKDHAP